jgi:hypothetical protein
MTALRANVWILNADLLSTYAEISREHFSLGVTYGQHVSA